MPPMSRVISIHYTLTNDSGEELDSSRGGTPLTYLEGVGNIIPGLEEEVAKLQKGDAKTVKVKAADAYGEKRSDLVMEVPRSQFPPDVEIKVGDRFQTQHGPHAPIFQVRKVTETHVMIDGNHPLAGVDLTFAVEVTEIRPATDEEITHGHAHGPDGHHHH
ncbi:MAG: peptidylprolyl isomerase [Bdellovibrionales bacterium]|nr:peptidylprolyl isomerase [Bdellovibrionales bacterium]